MTAVTRGSVAFHVSDDELVDPVGMRWDSTST
jgi:hypothetical protein